MLLSIIMEVKKSLVPAEDNERAVNGGVQCCPVMSAIPDICASTAPSYSLAEQVLIEVDV